jgi:3-oxoacyl-[acyl-carrier-protein] synthase III
MNAPLEVTPWKPHGGAAVRIVGAGAYVPPHIVTAEQIARAIPGWPASKIVEKTGVLQRRFLWPLDGVRGEEVPAKRAPAADVAWATDMGEIALSRALTVAAVPASDIDILVVVTCTPDQPRFSHDAMEIQHRLGIRRSAHSFVVDSGCGGSLYILDMLARMMNGANLRTAAIVGTNLTSALLDRNAYTQEGVIGSDGESMRPYLSTYVFGDGAGALVLRRDPGSALGVHASMAGNEHSELVRSPGGGARSPAYGDRYNAIDHTFIVNGRLVRSSYIETMQRCIRAVVGPEPRDIAAVERFYLHQPNERVLRHLSGLLELCDGQLASNVARVGNTSSAGMFTLLAEDLESGRVSVGSGAPVVFAAIGAGVHYGAQLAYL